MPDYRTFTMKVNRRTHSSNPTLPFLEARHD